MGSNHSLILKTFITCSGCDHATQKECKEPIVDVPVVNTRIIGVTSSSIVLRSTWLYVFLALSARICSNYFSLVPMIVPSFTTRMSTNTSAKSAVCELSDAPVSICSVVIFVCVGNSIPNGLSCGEDFLVLTLS